MLLFFKQIELDQHKSAEHDMMICQKRREEFISILMTWYEMDWSEYFNLSELLILIRDTFEVNFGYSFLLLQVKLFR